jgi:hypothetical protein
MDQVYADQMNHVRKGCLARKRQDVRSDGSRIEGSHKGWNSLQRAQPSGIAVFVALGHDHVLRRNMRIATADNKSSPFTSFDTSTYGSHHTRLVNHTSKLWNKLRLSKHGNSSGLLALPELKLVNSGEQFGLVGSESTVSFGGLFLNEVKTELKSEDSLLSLDSGEDLNQDLEDERLRVVDELGIDPQLLSQPLVQPTANTSTLGISRSPIVSNSDTFTMGLSYLVVSSGLSACSHAGCYTIVACG